MKKIFVLIVALSCFTTLIQAQLVKKLEGNNKYITVRLRLDDFHRISADNSINVNYVQNKDSAGIISVYGEENVLEKLTVDSKGGLLTLGLPNLQKKEFGIILINVYSSYLTQIECMGGTVVEVKGLCEGAELKIEIIGSGQVKAENIDYSIVKTYLTGGESDLLLAGKCNTANYSLIGGGEVRAHKLIAKECKVSLTGNGNVGCYASKTLKASITGSGNIYYMGNPLITKRLLGSGKVLLLPE